MRWSDGMPQCAMPPGPPDEWPPENEPPDGECEVVSGATEGPGAPVVVGVVVETGFQEPVVGVVVDAGFHEPVVGVVGAVPRWPAGAPPEPEPPVHAEAPSPLDPECESGLQVVVGPDPP